MWGGREGGRERGKEEMKGWAMEVQGHLRQPRCPAHPPVKQ